MTARFSLNIAVNLGRLGRWSHEAKTDRIPQFLADTQNYLDQLHGFNPGFTSTYESFIKDYSRLKSLLPATRIGQKPPSLGPTFLPTAPPLLASKGHAFLI